VIWEGRIRRGHILGRYRISGTMSALMGVDREVMQGALWLVRVLPAYVADVTGGCAGGCAAPGE
jgi:hypothetical protein